MASSLFRGNSGNSALQAADALRRAANGDPQALYERLYRTNPQFKAFAESVRGKTPQEAFREHGLDFDEARRLMGR